MDPYRGLPLQVEHEVEALRTRRVAALEIDRADAIAIRMMMFLALSYDHRVIDGATGARFLQVFKTYIEDPAAMLL